MHGVRFARMDKSAIVSGLFLPLLAWTGSVLAVTAFGYPGVIWITPAAWLLGVPVGLRVRRESHSLGGMPLIEAGLAGTLMGIWQGGLMTVIGMAYSDALYGFWGSQPPVRLTLIILVAILSIPACALTAILSAKLLKVL